MSVRQMVALGLVVFGASTPELRAQSGAGATGPQVLQLPAGSRAPALSGAYASASSDADVLFYNPAGAAALHASGAFAYQRFVQDIALGSASGVVRLGPVIAGLAVAFLDAGSVDVIEPDPLFGGERGVATGATASASETAARVAVALPLRGDRVRLGAAVGYASSSLAGTSRGAPFADVGAQLALGRVTFGASLRNLGGSMSGSGAQDVKLPTEARAGATVEWANATGLGALVTADVISDVNASVTTLAGGVEAGLLPSSARQLGLVARAGYGAGATESLGGLTLGGGLSLGAISLDYTYQNLDLFGPLHRVGVRWSRRAR